MRLVLMSDIHGNRAALEAVVDSLPPCDRVIVAGDLCLDGPDPAGVFDILVELNWELIAGNTDSDLIHSIPNSKGGKRDLVSWTREQLGSERLERLAHLPFSLSVEMDQKTVALVVHANPINVHDHLPPSMTDEDVRPYLEGVTADVLAFGHLHIPYVRPVDGTLLIDVSSVGHPKDLDARAAYTVVDWTGPRRSVTQVRIPYDVDRTVDEMRRCGMPHAEKKIASLLKASY
ncbi:MAG: metallophosphoesterase family protein [Chloroflexota bacterium]